MALPLEVNINGRILCHRTEIPGRGCTSGQQVWISVCQLGILSVIAIIDKIMINISNKQRASYVGLLILVAYSMLTYTITNNEILGVITDIISGLAVIGIPLLMFPIFNTTRNKTLNYAYLTSKFFEGILMIIGGCFILIPALERYRVIIYKDIHISFYIRCNIFLHFILSHQSHSKVYFNMGHYCNIDTFNNNNYKIIWT